MRPWVLLGLTAACSPSLVILPELPTAPGGSQLLAIVAESGPPQVYADDRPAPPALLSLPDDPAPRHLEAHVFDRPLSAAGLYLRPGPQTLGGPTDLPWAEVRSRAAQSFQLDLADPSALAWTPLGDGVDALDVLDDLRLVETPCAELSRGVDLLLPPVPELAQPTVAALLPHPDGVLLVVEDAAVSQRRPFALFVVRPDGKTTRVDLRLPTGEELLCRCRPNGFVNLCCAAATHHTVVFTAVALDGRPLLAVRSCPNGDELGVYAVEGTTLVELGRRARRVPACDESKLPRQPDCSSWVERLEPPECWFADVLAIRQPRLLAFQTGAAGEVLLLSQGGTTTPARAELVRLGPDGESPITAGLERLPTLGEVNGAALLERPGLGWLGAWGTRRTGLDRHALFQVSTARGVEFAITDLVPGPTELLPSPIAGEALIVAEIGAHQSYLLDLTADRVVEERLVGDWIPPRGVSRTARPEEPRFVRQCSAAGPCRVIGLSPRGRACASWALTDRGDPSAFAPPGLWTWDGARLSSFAIALR